MIRQSHCTNVQKITIYIPKDLLATARKASHNNITETIKSGLQLLIAEKACENLRKMRGKGKFTIDLKKLREDR
jgi:post-segregation antitoxin (ccd killing protein)